MTISVVIACRNEAATLSATLDALDAQDWRDLEIVVVDGCSSDGSAELARRRGARVVRDEGGGPAAARNLGIAAARGDIVAFTDADCIPRFDWLARLAVAFDDPEVAGAAGGLRLPRATLLGRIEDNDARLRYRGYITSNVAYRREALLQIGGFDASLQCAEDYDLAWRMLDGGYRIVHVPDAIVLHAPPELAAGLGVYLRKQYWYARRDVPAHARALGRAWRAGRMGPGARAALTGFGSALGRSAPLAAATAAVMRRAPWVAGAALAGIAARSTRDIRESVRAVDGERREVARMAAVDAAKNVARGAGTLVGLAQLLAARPGGPLTPLAAPALEDGPPLARLSRT